MKEYDELKKENRIIMWIVLKYKKEFEFTKNEFN